MGTDAELLRDSRGIHKKLLDWSVGNDRVMLVEEDRLT